MDMNSFEKKIFQNWADHFELSPDILQQNGTTLVPAKKYQGENLIVLWQIGSHAIIQCDPAIADRLRGLIHSLPDSISLTGGTLREAWLNVEFTSHDIGLLYYLFPRDLPAYLPPQPYSLRVMAANESQAMTELHAANSAEDVDEAYVEIDHPIVYGCFDGTTLTAAASGYERTGFLDIGVITHPKYRRQGLGKAVTGGLCQWALDHEMIAQYRHNINNLSSKHVATSLNFRQYFRSESLVIKS